MISQTEIEKSLKEYQPKFMELVKQSFNLYLTEIGPSAKLYIDPSTQASLFHNFFFGLAKDNFIKYLKGGEIYNYGKKGVYLILPDPYLFDNLIVIKFKKLDKNQREGNVETGSVDDFSHHNPKLEMEGNKTYYSLILGYIPNEEFTNASLYFISPNGFRNSLWVAKFNENAEIVDMPTEIDFYTEKPETVQKEKRVKISSDLLDLKTVKEKNE